MNITLTTNAAKILAGLEQLTPNILNAVARKMDYENQLTVGHIQKTKLSQRGEMTLGVVTNRARGSLRASRAAVLGQEVRSSIGSNVRYLGVHEFGSNETVTVRAHTRRVMPRGGGSAREIAAAKPTTQKVRAHTRRLNFRERRMIRTGIAERAANYSRAISAGIVEGWNQ